MSRDRLNISNKTWRIVIGQRMPSFEMTVAVFYGTHLFIFSTRHTNEKQWKVWAGWIQIKLPFDLYFVDGKHSMESEDQLLSF